MSDTVRFPVFLLICVPLTACRQGLESTRFRGAPVVLISIDTLRADHLPVYGYRALKTPHIDRFRRDAILYRNAYSPCPMTLPTHVSMLTGLLPPEHGVRGNVGYAFDSRAFPHLPGLLKACGYSTGAAVSTYVLRGDTGLAGMFDYYEDSIDALHGTAFAEQQRCGTITADLAKRWIDQHRRQSFLFFFHIYEPHVPYEPPEPYRSRFGHPYDGEIGFADAIVGDLLEHLRATGVYDRALLIVTSDHGEGLGDHGEDQHSILIYTEAIRVPLLMKLPGSRMAGRAVDAPAQLTDLVPTVAAILGIKVPEQLHGTPLLRLMGPDRPQRTTYSETLYPRIHLGWSDLKSVADDRWHYIHGPKPELYDLVRDPGEISNLIATNREVSARLRSELFRYPQGRESPEAVDAAIAERLATLGYVGSARARGPSSNLPNPRDHLQGLDRLREGFRLAAERRHEQAAATLAAVVKENPAMVEAWIRLGEVLAEAGRSSEAAQAFEQALARSPVAFGDVLISLGYARLRASQPEQATAAAHRATGAVPAKAHELLARVALWRHRLDEAEAEARASVDQRNPQPSSHLIGAEVRMRRGDYAGALRILDQVERLAGERKIGTVSNLEFLRADALARVGRTGDAEAAYRREIAAFPGSLLAYANLAALLYAQRKTDAVGPMLEKMVRANPNGRAHEVAAATLEAFGDRANAAQWRARAARHSGAEGPRNAGGS